MADGTLRFDTKIDTDGFENDTRTLKGSLNSFINSLKGVGNNIANAFTGTGSIDKTDSSIKNLVDEIDRYKDSLYYLEKQGLYFGDKEYDEAYQSLSLLENELNQYKKELSNVNTEQNKTSKSAKDMGKSMKKADSNVSGFSKTLSLLKMSLLFSVAFRAMSAATTAISDGFKNLSQYSTTTNKTLSALATSLLTLKNSLATAFSPILTAITPALQTLIGYLTTAITVMGEFFSYLITGATTFTRAKDAQVDYAASVKKAAQEAKKALSPIDRLNEVSDDSGGGNGGYTGPSPSQMFEEVPINSKITDAVNGLKKALEPTIEALKKLNEQLNPLKAFVAQALIDFYNKFLKPVGTWVLGNGIPGLATAFGNLLKNIDWNSLNKALADLFEALGKFTIGIGQGLVDFAIGLSEALSPVIGKTLNIVGKGLDILADAINSLSPQTVEDLGKSLGILFASLALAKTLTGVAGVLTGISGGLAGLAGGLAMFATLNPMAFVAMFNGLFEDLEAWVEGNIEEKFGKIWNKFLIVFANAGLGAATGFYLGGPIGAIIGALIGGLIAAIHEFDFTPVWEAIKTGLSAFLGSVFNWDSTQELFGDMIGYFKAALNGDNIIDIGKNIVFGLFNGVVAAFALIFEPFIDLFMGIINGVKDLFGIHSPSTVFAEIGGYLVQGLYNGVKAIINTVLQIFKDLWTNIQNVFKDIGTWFKTKFQSAYDTVKGVFKGIGTWFGERWADIKTAFSATETWFKTTFSTAWANIKTAFTLSSIKTFFSGIWSGIQSAFSHVSKWFKDTFTEAWTNVKNVFSTGGKIFDGIKDGIADVFKSVVNKLIDGINAIITVPFNKINSMLNTIRSVSILGAKPFSGLWSQNPLSVPKIPKLATGAVIPPNSQFLALLGDQKRGTNIEAPLDTIVEAFQRVVGGSGAGDMLHITLTLPDGKVLFDTVVQAEKENYKSTGKPIFVH